MGRWIWLYPNKIVLLTRAKQPGESGVDLRSGSWLLSVIDSDIDRKDMEADTPFIVACRATLPRSLRQSNVVSP